MFERFQHAALELAGHTQVPAAFKNTKAMSRACKESTVLKIAVARTLVGTAFSGAVCWKHLKMWLLQKRPKYAS